MKFLNNLDVRGYITQSNALNTMLKADASGKLVPAIAGVDYLLSANGGSTNKIQHEVKLGESMTIGTPVYIPIAQDSSTNMVVMKASNSSESTSSKTLGLLAGSGVTGDFVNVITEGLLEGLNTSTASKGDPVWLGSNGTLIFGLANKPTAPNHLVFIGIVTRSNANNGEIFVKVQNGFETDELHDVIANGRTAGNVMYWDGSINRYASISSVLGYTPYNATNPNGYISGITGTMVTNALGYTPYNATNPNGYITSASLTWANISGKPTALSQFTNDLGNYGGWITGITSLMVTNALGFTPYNSTNPNGYITSSSLTWSNISGRPTALSQFTQDIGAITTGNTGGVIGAKYQINDTWLRVNSDNRQLQFYGNSRTMIYRTDGNTNDHGGGGYAHIFYYGGSADSQRCFIINTDGRLYSPYHGWLDTMSISGTSGGAPWSGVSGKPGNLTYWDTWYGSAYLGSNGDLYQGYRGEWQSTINARIINRNGDTIGGQILFQMNNGGYAVNNSNSAGIQAYSTGNNTAFMSFHRGGYWATNFGLDQDNWIRIGGWSAGANRFQFNAVSGDFVANGDVTAFSDVRVKENIVTIDNALSKVLSLRGVYYNRIDSTDKSRKVGVIAQETLPILPEVVNQDAFGTYNVAYGNMGGLFIEAFKEQNAKIKEQQDIIDYLLKEIKNLKEVINGITK